MKQAQIDEFVQPESVWRALRNTPDHSARRNLLMQSWELVLFALCAFLVLGIIFDAGWHHRSSKRVMDLLQEHGQLTGLELSRDHRIPRSHVYLILNRLELDGKIEGCKPKNPVYNGQKAWRVK